MNRPRNKINISEIRNITPQSGARAQAETILIAIANKVKNKGITLLLSTKKLTIEVMNKNIPNTKIAIIIKFNFFC